MKRLLFAGTYVFCCCLFTQAQKVTRLEAGDKGFHPSLIEFASTSAPVFKKGNVIIVNNDDLKSNISDSALLLNADTDHLGFEHYRYQQILNGITVENAIYILHVKTGKVLSENGRWIKNIPLNFSRTTNIAEAEALKIALTKINAQHYKWEDNEPDALAKTRSEDLPAISYPKAKLVYYASEDDATAIHLSYKFDIYSKEPLSRQLIYIDAQTGAVLGTKELIETIDTEGKATTVYNGTQNVKTTLNNRVYTLKETTRGNGIITLNMQNKTVYGAAVDFTDADNNWNNVNAVKDQYATDAHWAAEKTYDFYLQNFKRNSIDNKGYALKSYVHYNKNYFNAFWDGSVMTYGDGNAFYGNKPLTTLDICGHEITHGLTSYTADLNYGKESGALNEGFSDIFGTAIEWFARPAKKDWLIGSDFYTMRSMSNPNAYNQPDTYKGIYWYTGNNDNGGVHTNSGVLNYWFYLLSNGGSGTNDKAFSFKVAGIGMQKAQAIAYRTLVTYLVPTSVYKDARIYSIKSAEDLFGKGSNEVTQTIKAWDAVGVTENGAGIVNSTNVSHANEGIAEEIKVNKLYPNPTQNYLIMEFTDNKPGKRKATIYDLSGKLIYGKYIKTVQGNNRLQVNLPSLVDGTYVLKVDNVHSGIFSVKH
jgi:Zn-dependent metalloprotease